MLEFLVISKVMTFCLPIKEKTAPQGLLNFVGFATDITQLQCNIVGFDKSTNT